MQNRIPRERMKYAFPFRRVFRRGWPAGVQDVASSPKFLDQFLETTYSRSFRNYIDSSLSQRIACAPEEQHREAGVPGRVPARGPRAVLVLRAHQCLNRVRIPHLTAETLR